MKRNMGIIGQIILFIVALIWGTSFVVLKNMLDSISALWVLSFRFLFSSLILGLFAGKKLFTLRRESYRAGALLGLSVVGAYLFQTYGLVYTTPGKNAFLSAAYCVLTPFIAWLCYRKKPGRGSVLAALLCFCGIGFVSLSGGEGEAAFNIGDVLTVGCGAFYAWQIVLLEKHREGCDAFSLTSMQFGWAGLACLVLALIFEPFPVNAPLGAWLGLVYLTLACTALCFFLQAWALKYVDSGVGSIIMCLESVFGVLISVIFYNEKLTLMLLIGFSLIFAAVLISELAGETKKESPGEEPGQTI